MELWLKRSWFTDKSTTGMLYIDGIFECYTLEDPVREEKIAGSTAIPEGRYKLLVTWSNRFQRRMPLLLDVPNFEGIRIHTGNIPEDTEGCILVGRQKGIDRIWESRLAFDQLFEKLLMCDRDEIEMWLTIN